MRAVLKTGCAARYDTFHAGLVPCKVLSVTRDPNLYSHVNVKFRVTAERYGYRVGETLEASSYFVVPREAVRSRKYSGSIVAYDVQID